MEAFMLCLRLIGFADLGVGRPAYEIELLGVWEGVTLFMTIHGLSVIRHRFTFGVLTATEG